MSTKIYDYIKSVPDKRDYRFGDSNIDASRLSENSEKPFYKIKVARIEQQGALSSCVSFGMTTAFEHLVQTLCNDNDFQASPLYNYTQSRILDSENLSEDIGTTLRSGCGNLRLTGICRDSVWPYTRTNSFLSIPENVTREASLLSGMIDYFEVNRNRQVIKYIVGDLNLLIPFGFTVYTSFESDKVYETGDVPMPDMTKEKILGGHCCNITGWDDDRQVYFFVNSYGKEWGNDGEGTIPYAYFENYDLVTEAKVLFPRENFAEKYQAYKNTIENFSPTTTRTFIPSWFVIIIISIFFVLFGAIICYYGLRMSNVRSYHSSTDV